MERRDPADAIMEFLGEPKVPTETQKAAIASVRLAYNTAASIIRHTCPGNAERTTALRKLLESKDAAVRAVLVLLES